MELLIDLFWKSTHWLEKIAIHVEIGILLFVMYGCYLEYQARNILQKDYEYDKKAYKSAMELISEFLLVLKRRNKRYSKPKVIHEKSTPKTIPLDTSGSSPTSSSIKPLQRPNTKGDHSATT